MTTSSAHAVEVVTDRITREITQYAE